MIDPSSAGVFAFGRAVLEGDGTVAVTVAVRHPKANEPDRAMVAPCGACRELFLDHARRPG